MQKLRPVSFLTSGRASLLWIPLTGSPPPTHPAPSQDHELSSQRRGKQPKGSHSADTLVRSADAWEPCRPLLSQSCLCCGELRASQLQGQTRPRGQRDPKVDARSGPHPQTTPGPALPPLLSPDGSQSLSPSSDHWLSPGPSHEPTF